MKGAMIYLSQQEMGLVLEALDLLEGDVSPSLFKKQIKDTSNNIQQKIFLHWKGVGV